MLNHLINNPIFIQWVFFLKKFLDHLIQNNKYVRLSNSMFGESWIVIEELARRSAITKWSNWENPKWMMITNYPTPVFVINMTEMRILFIPIINWTTISFAGRIILFKEKRIKDSRLRPLEIFLVPFCICILIGLVLDNKKSPS